MKKLLGILVLGLLVCNTGFAETNNKNTVEVLICYNKNWKTPIIFSNENVSKCYEGLYDTWNYRKLKSPWNIFCYNPANGIPKVIVPQNDSRNSKGQQFIFGPGCKKLGEPWKILKHISTKGNIEKFSYMDTEETQNDSNNNISQQLKDLNEMYKSGALTKKEFEKAKKKLLN